MQLFFPLNKICDFSRICLKQRHASSSVLFRCNHEPSPFILYFSCLFVICKINNLETCNPTQSHYNLISPLTLFTVTGLYRKPLTINTLCLAGRYSDEQLRPWPRTRRGTSPSPAASPLRSLPSADLSGSEPLSPWAHPSLETKKLVILHRTGQQEATHYEREHSALTAVHS